MEEAAVVINVTANPVCSSIQSMVIDFRSTTGEVRDLSGAAGKFH